MSYRKKPDNGMNWGMRRSSVSYNEILENGINWVVGGPAVSCLSCKKMLEMVGEEVLPGASASCH